jgi:cell division septal protein FtsQ
MGLGGSPPPMDDRMRKRRRSVRWERSRGRRTTLFLVGLLLCSVVAFLVLRSTDVFAVKRVTASGSEQITREQIASITSEAMGKNLLSLSTDGIKKALLQLPYVESAQVSRAFPSTLQIHLVEYRPVARLESGEMTWLVSDTGKVLKDPDPAQLPGLPLLAPDVSFVIAEGQQLPAALADVLPLAEYVSTEDMRAKLPAIKKIAVSAAGCAALVLKDGGELRLGTPDGLEEKLGVAVDIVQKWLAEGRLIEYIDASVADRVAVKAK